MHECPECGAGCCCDQEDVFHEYGEAVESCTHVCRERDDDDDGWDDDDDCGEDAGRVVNFDDEDEDDGDSE